MIDVQKSILQVMKKEIFSSTDAENKAARQVFSELKTKQKDVLTELTVDIQYKFLKKMKAERADSIKIYTDANRVDLLEKEQNEFNVLSTLLLELEKDMPKMLTIDEINNILLTEINNIGKEKANIGILMRRFKDIKNVDKSLVAQCANKLLR